MMLPILARGGRRSRRENTSLASARQRGNRRKFLLEVMEERTLLSLITINTDALTITGAGASGTVYGVPYTAQINGGVADFYIKGDLNLVVGDSVKGVGSHPAALLVGNNATIPTGVTFDFSAVALVAGPGGGASGGAGAGGAGGAGGASGTVGIGGTGGAGGTTSPTGAPGVLNLTAGANGGVGGTGINVPAAAPGQSGGAGLAGTSGFNSPASAGVGGAGGAGGSAGASAGSLGTGGAGGTGGLFGSNTIGFGLANGQNGGAGSSGGAGGSGSAGVNATTGTNAGAGLNTGAGLLLSGGGAGGGGGGTGGGGGGGNGAPGSGGGGGGGGGGTAGWTSGLNGGAGGPGGPGGTGGHGGSGQTGGAGISGGAGGGAFSVTVYGRSFFGNALNSLGGNSSGSSTVVSSSDQTAGGSGAAGTAGAPGGSQTQAFTVSAGNGGPGGAGGGGGNGGAAGQAALGAGGGGGAGGTVWIAASDNHTAGSTANTSGGSGTSGAASGGNGRFIFGNNSSQTLQTTITNASLTTTSGPTRANPYIPGNPATPMIPNLVGGAEAFGITGQSTVLDYHSVLDAAPHGSGVALLKIHVGGTPVDTDFPGYDYLLFINLENSTVLAPSMGVGGTIAPLQVEGFANDPLFGGAGPQTLASLGAYQVFTTLVPTASTNYQAQFTSHGQTFTGATVNLTNGVPFYIDASVSSNVPVGVPINAIVNTPFTNQDVATFTDNDPNAVASDFNTTILWGDGTSNAGIVTRDASHVFHVTGSHTYAGTGNYTITVTTQTGAQAPVSGSSTATVTLSPVAAGPVAPINGAVEGKALSNVAVATFTDANPTAPISDFTATIDWGDGSPQSSGVITQPGGVGTSFTVSGTHTYAEESATSLPVQVTVIDSRAYRATATSSVTSVADAALINGTGLAIKGVEGAAIANVPVATFTDANPKATVADFFGTITWGDTTTSPATFVMVGGSAAGVTFQVFGSHTYAIAGSYTTSVAVSDVGGKTTSATSTAAVAAAPITATFGTVTGIEGNVVSGIVATFTSAKPGASASEFTATIKWGDGTPNSTGTIATVGTPNGVVFQVTASHTYAEAGTYPVVVTIASAAGATGIATGNAVIADAPLTLSARGVSPNVQTEGVPFTATLLNFTDGNPGGTVSDFKAVIDWGDGTPMSAGTVAQAGGLFDVTGTHTYADSLVNGGSHDFDVKVWVTDKEGANLFTSVTQTVNDVPIVLTGALNPHSDSGVSKTDGITNVAQPNFFGGSEPLSTVRVYAVPNVGGGAFLIAQGTTDTSGYWNVTSFVRIPDGSYTVMAAAVDAAGHTTAMSTVQTAAGGGPLVIDTVGPKVNYVQFDRLNGQILVTFQDERSGMNLYGVNDASNYLVTKAHQKLPGTYLVTSLIPTGGAATDPVTVPVVINYGKSLRGGRYNFTIKSGGITDIAGNALDGEFYGYFPSGNNRPGGDFVARLDAIHHLILPAATVVGPATPVNPPGTKPVKVVIKKAVVPAKQTVGAFNLAGATHAHDVAIAHVQVPKRKK